MLFSENGTHRYRFFAKRYPQIPLLKERSVTMTRKTQPIRRFVKVNAPIVWPLLDNDPLAYKIYWIMCSAMNRDSNKVFSKKTLSLTISKFLGINERTARNKIQLLVKQKYIKRSKINIYHVNPWGSNAKNYLINNLNYCGNAPKPDVNFQENLEEHFHIKTFADIKKKDYEALGTSDTEKDRRMEALEREMVEIKEQLKLIVGMLTPEQKKEAERHLTLVPSE